jgi:hypothetical protein
LQCVSGVRTAAAVAAAILAVSIPFAARAQSAEPGSNPRPVTRLEAEPMDPEMPLSAAEAARHSPPTTPMPALAPRDKLSPQTASALALLSPIVSTVAGGLLWSRAAGNDDVRRTGMGLVAFGIWVAPSAGHMYSGEWAHAIGWSLVRSATSTFGVLLMAASQIHSSDCQGSQCDTSTSGLAVGAGLVLVAAGSAVYDILDAPSAAERTNKRLAATDLALAPILPLGAGAGSMRGLALVARF